MSTAGEQGRSRVDRPSLLVSGRQGDRPPAADLQPRVVDAATVNSSATIIDHDTTTNPTKPPQRTSPNLQIAGPGHFDVLRHHSAPPAGFEPALPPPEGGALSPELRGPRSKAQVISASWPPHNVTSTAGSG